MRTVPGFRATATGPSATPRPIARDMRSLITGDPGDPVLNASILLWSATPRPFSAEWWNAPHYYPAGGVGGSTENLVGISPFATPVYWVTGNPILVRLVQLDEDDRVWRVSELTVHAPAA